MHMHSSYVYESGTHRPRISAYKRPPLSFLFPQILLSSLPSPIQMAPRKVYPPPSRFSRRLATLRAHQARDEAGPENAAPHNNGVVDISNNSDSEQVPEYVPGEGAGIEEEDEDIPEYVPGAEQLGEGEYKVPGEPEEEPEDDPEEDPEENPEDDPEEEPQEEQPDAMEQEEENHGEEQEDEDQEMTFG
ncbi:hypothetical protein PIB30_016253 [Stylosanthes scabra]|uniref:Uncharacterized protein n=1 Tax=Stylosanthes scabra TaxID=79078 RepID=A0ABU6Y4H2_9FABA|nr:hypothetical protein [Stylosanthes scabra]